MKRQHFVMPPGHISSGNIDSSDEPSQTTPLVTRVIEVPSSSRQMTLMEQARASGTFDSRTLTYIIYDGVEAVKRREAAFSRVEAALGEQSDPMKLPRSYGDLNRTGFYIDGLQFGNALIKDEVQNRHGIFDRTTHLYQFINSSPFGLHPAMFIPTLKLQATAEQLAYWLPLAEAGKIIGTYCQTELGHGTFVRGLETTATFDPKTDEFIIHSPTPTSTKYWPGGLGFCCSHAIIMARLIIGENDHGVHPFMTQLRSLDDFKPLPGIELGDIGLKMGLNSTDNGYAVFTHVRIPRMHLLMGNARVLRDGTYHKAPHDKLTYSTMLYTRNSIVQAAGLQLAQAATIAIRYSIVREQGVMAFDPTEDQEVPIISFKSQHYRLLSIMSRAFALLFSGKDCASVYQDLVTRQKRGDHSTLAYGHITTAALKAYATQVAADGAEDARKCCGGHGYSLLSGLPDIVSSVTSMATLEGENYVMYQQTARYLMKCATAIRKGEAIDAPVTYLRDGYHGGSVRCSAQGSEFLNPDVQLSIFRHRSVRLIFDCEELLRDSQTQEGLSAASAWNTHMMALIAAARAHIEFFVLHSFVKHVSMVKDPSVHKVLKSLCDLFALTTIESPLSIGALGFFEDGHISSSQLRGIRTHVNSILSSLIPDAVALTDAWNFSDASLQSALGRKDGNVYETMLAWTRQLPINLQAAKSGGIIRPGYEEFIRPILQAKL